MSRYFRHSRGGLEFEIFHPKTPFAILCSGQGILPYTIANFTVNNPGEYLLRGSFFVVSGTVCTPSSNELRVVVSSTLRALVPEPQEYALAFGIFALGFAFLRPDWQKKRQATAAG